MKSRLIKNTLMMSVLWCTGYSAMAETLPVKTAPVIPMAKVVNVTDTANATQTNAVAQTPVKKAKGLWIDVRTPEEYKAGHIRKAKNIPVDVIANQISKIAPKKDTQINLYCRTGRRAAQAATILKEMGYSNVTNQGGYEDLLKKGIK